MTDVRRPRLGYTLIEIVVVVSIIGIVAGLLLSALQSSRAAASRIACANNLRQVALACHHYQDQHNALPPAYAKVSYGMQSHMAWPVLLLPFIEHEPLWTVTIAAHRQTSLDYLNPPHVGLSTVVKVYTCPSDGRLGTPITDDRGYTAAYGSYVGVAGGTRADGALRSQSGVRIAEITDGSSNTLLIGERPPAGRLLSGNWYSITIPDLSLHQDPAWGGPGISYLPMYTEGDEGTCRGPFRFGPGSQRNHCDSFHFWSLHPGGANFILADGSVHFLRYTAVSVMPALSTRAGGEVVELP